MELSLNFIYFTLTEAQQQIYNNISKISLTGTDQSVSYCGEKLEYMKLTHPSYLVTTTISYADTRNRTRAAVVKDQSVSLSAN